MASCADEFDRNFEVTRPELSAEYAYLNDYKALKEYVSDPNFKLGISSSINKISSSFGANEFRVASRHERSGWYSPKVSQKAI